MPGYNKLVPEIIQSSIWNEPDSIRIVWITMLAIKDADGNVRGDAGTLSRLANVSLENTEEALRRFSAPDPKSGTPDNNGRRIVEIPGGWNVLNHHLYRTGDRSEYMREYMRKYRARHAGKGKSSKPNRKTVPASASDGASESAPEAKKPEKKPSFDLPFASDKFKEAWNSWIKHRSELKKHVKPGSEAAKRQLKMLAAWGEERAIAAIEHTIFKGWQGLREPEEERKPVGRAPRIGTSRFD